MSSASSAVFSGQSTFSSDFQQVLTRAVAIASLPIQTMQNSVSKLSAEQQALAGLQSNFASVQTALQSIGNAVQGSLTSQSSQPLAASASVTKDAIPGTYSIAVDTVGSSSTTLSKSTLKTVTDATDSDFSSSSSFTLTLNNVPHTITTSGSSMLDLANAINGAAVGVHATIVNVGPNANPDYRLAVTSDSLGGDTIQLNDGTQDLLDSVTTGAPATYRVNGGTTELQSNSSEVTLGPGLTVRLLSQTTADQPATITVSSDYTSLQSALQSFATAYNSAVDAVAGQRGSNAGPLAGQSSVFALGNALQSVSQYTGTSGSVNTLTSLGLNLDQNGHLSFDASVFSGDDTSAIQQFLGSTDGTGFLKNANDVLSSMADSSTGLIHTDIAALGDHINSLNSQMNEVQNRVDDLQTNLLAQLTAADAAIATLQSQKSYFTNLFAATYLNNNGTSSNG